MKELSELKEAAKQKLSETGLRLQMKTARLLKCQGWAVELESAYTDDIEGVIRRIDLVATKTVDDFAIMLLIECKFFKNSLSSVLLRDQSREFVSIDMAKDAIQIKNTELKKRLSDSVHHYITSVIAITQQGLDVKDLSKNSDPLYEASNQVIKPLIYFRQKSSVNTIFYPLIITDGNFLLSADITVLEKPSVEIADLDQCDESMLAVSYVAPGSNRSEVFLLDIVHIERLDEFLKCRLQKEITEVVDYASSKKHEAQLKRLTQQSRNWRY